MSKKELHEEFQDVLSILEFKVGHLHKYGKVTEDDIDVLSDTMIDMANHWKKVNKELREKKS